MQDVRAFFSLFRTFRKFRDLHFRQWLLIAVLLLFVDYLFQNALSVFAILAIYFWFFIDMGLIKRVSLIDSGDRQTEPKVTDIFDNWKLAHKRLDKTVVLRMLVILPIGLVLGVIGGLLMVKNNPSPTSDDLSGFAAQLILNQSLMMCAVIIFINLVDGLFFGLTPAIGIHEPERNSGFIKRNLELVRSKQVYFLLLFLLQSLLILFWTVLAILIGSVLMKMEDLPRTLLKEITPLLTLLVQVGIAYFFAGFRFVALNEAYKYASRKA
jgi:hypothetical protein